MPVKQAATAGPEDAKRAAHMGCPGGAAVPPGKGIRPTRGVDRRRERPGESLWKDRPDAETAHPTQQKDLRLPRRLPAAPGAVQGGIENAVGRDSPAARRRPQTVRRWHKDGVRPNAHYLLALQDLAKGRGLGHLFTVRAMPYQTAESEGRGESGQDPGVCTTGGVQNAGRPGHSRGRGTPAASRKDQRCYAQRERTPQHR